MKRFLAIGSIVFSAALGFGVTAWAAGGGADEDTSGAEPTGSSGEGANDDPGLHGGPIERLHVPGSCDLVSTAGLPGNWTHGDYVTAVAALGNATLVVDAAHSDCGKPVHAVGHGLGSPAHALGHLDKVEKKEKPAEAREDVGEAPGS